MWFLLLTIIYCHPWNPLCLKPPHLNHILSVFLLTLISLSVCTSLFPQCDQDQCIQSTKFVLQAAATPPVILGGGGGGPPLPGKSTLGGPCAYLAPSQPSLPSSIPSLGCAGDVLTLRDTETHCHHHHFVSPEETPSPPGPPPCSARMPHVHPAQLYDLASQDSLHEDSVRGLVKLSSV